MAAFGTEQGLIGAFAVAALGYLCSALVLWPLRLPRHERLEAASVQAVWSDLVQGIRFLVGNTLVRTNTAIVALGAVAIGMAMPLLVGYAYARPERGEVAYSMLNFGIGVGSVAGAMLVGTLNARRLGSLVLGGLVVMGVGLFGLGLEPPLWLGVGLTALTGLGNMLFLVPSVTIVQRATPAHLMGRIFALRSTVLFTMLIAANGVGGWIGDWVGATRAFFLVGSVLVLATIMAMLLPSIWLADRLDELTFEPSS